MGKISTEVQFVVSLNDLFTDWLMGLSIYRLIVWLTIIVRFFFFVCFLFVCICYAGHFEPSWKMPQPYIVPSRNIFCSFGQAQAVPHAPGSKETATIIIGNNIHRRSICRFTKWLTGWLAEWLIDYLLNNWPIVRICCCSSFVVFVFVMLLLLCWLLYEPSWRCPG